MSTNKERNGYGSRCSQRLNLFVKRHVSTGGETGLSQAMRDFFMDLHRPLFRYGLIAVGGLTTKHILDKGGEDGRAERWMR
jgi:hypothetical protein